MLNGLFNHVETNIKYDHQGTAMKFYLDNKGVLIVCCENCSDIFAIDQCIKTPEQCKELASTKSWEDASHLGKLL